MSKVLLLVSLSVVCLVGGCTSQRICPPVQGTIVDAVTGKPIAAAAVKIEYFDAQRKTRTDQHGKFSFAAKHKLFPLKFVYPINVHLDRISGFRLEAEAEGYESGGVAMRDHGVSTESPPHEIPLYGPRPSHRMLYTGKAIIIDPIKLVPIQATKP